MWSWFSFFIGYLGGTLAAAAGLVIWGLILEARTNRIISRGQR